ncbi:MAG: transketolase C-terminal domain-containing protein, partial [Nanoarchaeota archaeon]
EKNKNVVVLCADLSESTRSEWFQKRFPERYVQVGVAEQNMASLASGMAAAGKVAFISSYAVFSPGRNNEQIRTTISYNSWESKPGREINVKIGGAHAGISVGPDGATHQALEDVGLMRLHPGMTVLVPCDEAECEKATIAAAEKPGPVYIRFGRAEYPAFTTEKTPFAIGRIEEFRSGNDCTIIANGPLVYEALLAAKKLEKEIDCQVLNCHTVKPLDVKTLIAAVKKTGCAVTAEEHQYLGGLGGAVAEALSEHYPVPIKRVGVKDHFGESGTPEELFKAFGLTSDDIVKAVRAAVKMKR